jgi:hypothetical protein
MLLHAAILPPRAAVAAVSAVVTGVPDPRPVEPVLSRGLLGRRARRDEPAPVEPMLDPFPVDGLRLPVTSFGNLTRHDAHRLVTALQDGLPRVSPVVSFSGGTALEFPGDWSVWAKLAGDVDALTEVARTVVRVVEGLGLFVDRRKFRPMLAVANVTTATTGPFLESVVAALDEHRGAPWAADLCLLREAFSDGATVLSEFERIPLAS